MLKIAMSALFLTALAVPAGAQYGTNNNNTFGTGSNSSSHTTRGYTTQSGTYVQPHRQTNPNNTQMDNYGTRGNVNPYTGQTGTRSPYR